MIGVSLPFGALAAGEGLGSDRYLCSLAEMGVCSVELRTVGYSEEPRAVLTAARRVWRQGMYVSVHVSPRSADGAQGDIFDPLTLLLGEEVQEKTVLVLHPVNGGDMLSENRRMLDSLTEHIRKSGNGALLALENNRFLPDNTPGDSAALAAELMGQVEPAFGGICFDFGHFAWFSRAWERERPILPPRQFLSRVIHTHIHALSGAHTTHFPLQGGILPLEAYLAALQPYGGILNLELEPPRFASLISGQEAIEGSVEVLKAAKNRQRPRT